MHTSVRLGWALGSNAAEVHVELEGHSACSPLPPLFGAGRWIALIDLMLGGVGEGVHEVAAGHVGGGGVKCAASTRSASGNTDDGDDTYGQTQKTSARKQEE